MQDHSWARDFAVTVRGCSVVGFSKLFSSSLPDEYQYGACDDLYDTSCNRNWGILDGLLLGDGVSLSTF